MSSPLLVEVEDAVRTKGTTVGLATRFIWILGLTTRPFQGSTTEHPIIFDSVLDYHGCIPIDGAVRCSSSSGQSLRQTSYQLFLV